MTLRDIVDRYTGAEQAFVMEKVDMVIPDFSDVEFFNENDVDLQEVLLGHTQVDDMKVQEERIVVMPVPSNANEDMRVVLMSI